MYYIADYIIYRKMQSNVNHKVDYIMNYIENYIVDSTFDHIILNIDLREDKTHVTC